jgi:hypothetical protein
MTDDFKPKEITADTDDEDAVPVEADEVPEVAEDPVPEDDASTAPKPPTEGDG